MSFGTSNKPTLVISHNKTLAAQLYAEFKGFFPDNAVEYFVSYFDYYQPEAYIPRTDTFIEKDSSINEEIERMRLSTMSSLFARRDVVVVASVSCIYGIGSKEDYEAMVVPLRVGQEITREQLLSRLVDMQYNRNDIEFDARQFSRARRHGGGLSGLHGRCGADGILRRQGRAAHALRSADGRHHRDAAGIDDLSGQAIRHARRQDEARHARDPRGTDRSHRVVRSARASCSKRSASRCARNTIWR